MNDSVFSVYLQLGFHHIFNLQAYDHLAFLVALAAPFIWQNWRNVVMLATAFTIGHSVTLALAVLQIVPVNESLIETLIPVTILLTSFFNMVQQAKPGSKTVRFPVQNLAALGFGLIHGLGFSNMQQRAALIGARLTIDSTEGKGTEVIINVQTETNGE